MATKIWEATLAKCKRCKTPIDQLAQEQDVYRALIKWLNSITESCGCRWYLPYQDVRRPDKFGIDGASVTIRDPQYGVVFLGNEDRTDGGEDNADVVHEFENGFCTTFVETIIQDVTLEVYRQQGAAKGNDYPDNVDDNFLSARDVLNDIRRLFRNQDAARTRSGENFIFPFFKAHTDFTALVPSFQLRQSTWEWRCATSLKIEYCRKISYPIEKGRACVKLCATDEVLCGFEKVNC